MIAPPFVSVPPSRYGGTELVVAALVDGLLARGHQVTLYASGDSTSGTTLRAHFARPVWPPDPRFELVQSATAAWDLLERRDVDLVHAHTGAALAFAPLLPCPLVYTIHHDREEGTCELMRAAVARAPSLACVAISHRQRTRLGGIGGGGGTPKTPTQNYPPP
ncbi:MAG: glycosyltransferase, partial [Myxococcota bacterium]